jgi:hypothetical protein
MKTDLKKEDKFCIELNREIYDLRKIKLIDRDIFLSGCKVYGKKCYCCFPFWCGHWTKECRKAQEIFSLIDGETKC